MNKRQTLCELAESIADGADMDWASMDAPVGSGVSGDEWRLLRQLQLIACIAALHRTHAEDEIMNHTARILTRTEFEHALTLATVTSGIRKTAAIASLRASDDAMRGELDRLRLELHSKDSHIKSGE